MYVLYVLSRILRTIIDTTPPVKLDFLLYCFVRKELFSEIHYTQIVKQNSW